MSNIEYESGAAAAGSRVGPEPIRLAGLQQAGLQQAGLQQNGVSARLASAQFAIAARAADDSSQAPVTPPAAEHDDGHPTPTVPLGRILQVFAPAPLQFASTPQRADVVPAQDDAELRLPAAWYAKPQTPSVATEGLTLEQHAHLIRGVAAACLTTAAGLLIWLSTMSSIPPSAPPPGQSASLISGFAPGVAAVTAPVLPERRAAPEPASQDRITTAQILAVAERFIATGDILAARAMLQERAGLGEPRALFALAETYDPHMLSSWAARDADPSVTYARFLYEAARRGGVADAQTRIDALK